jgi:hypothetical protein
MDSAEAKIARATLLRSERSALLFFPLLPLFIAIILLLESPLVGI